MNFLSNLGSAINEQFSVGENNVSSLDTVDSSGNVTKYGMLGDFARKNKFDTSAQRTYIEDGFISNIRPNMRQHIWQEPDVTIVIKKKMFSSLAENYKSELMSEDEKLYIRACKKLFQNKLKVISAYESLTKIENIYKESGLINSFMMPTLMNGIATLSDAGILDNIMDQKTRSAFETLRKLQKFSDPSTTSNWSIDNDLPYSGDMGVGTGTIELTLATTINTKCSNLFGAGGCSIVFEDPYKLALINKSDIDMAIKDSSNYFKNSYFGRFTQVETQKLIEEQKAELNKLRLERRKSTFRFIVEPITIVSKKLQIILDGGSFGVGDVINPNQTAELNFDYNPGFAGIGSDVSIDDIAFTGQQAINDDEASLLKDVIRNIYLLLSYEQTTRSARIGFNEQTNYVRRKMMQQFNGRPIVQNMDIVNIFISSKTMKDDGIVRGFDGTSNALSFGQRLNSLVRNINTLSDKFGASHGSISPDEIEKNSIAGADFPMWLWRLYRNDFTRQNAGVCVFVGIAGTPSHRYSSSSGKYILSFNCEDNCGYFNKSQINFKPAVDVYNSNLYDPLTPFKTSFDGVSGDVLTGIQSGQFPQLLQENETILKSSAVKFHNGRFRGSPVDKLLYQANDEELMFNESRRVLNDPLGFVYRWKEGIGVLTKNEKAYPVSMNRQEFSPALTANPFAGQDVMNVLSLLITGQPYNYNTFLKSAIDNANALVANDEQNSKPSVTTYIEALTQELNKRNAVWGNFVPFKTLTINKAADQFIRAGLSDTITKQTDLLNKINERAGLADQLALINGGYATNPQIAATWENGQFSVPNTNITGSSSQDLERRISDLDMEITLAKQQFTDTMTNLAEAKTDGRITIIGDDVALQPSYSKAQSYQTESQRDDDYEEFRRRINSYTLRRFWKVKANDDNNLFVVSDQYDKSYDIQAFGRKLSGKLDLFKSEYTTIDTQIKQVSELLGLEVFADSQGNIQVRPPLYNRVPSSVFYQMFKDKERTGIQAFPQFLESLLYNQLQAQINRIEITEDEIRIRVLALGIVPTASVDPDKDIAGYLRGSMGNQSVSVDSDFTFVSDFRTGKVGGFDDSFRRFISQGYPDINEQFLNNSLKPVTNTLNQAAKATRLFDVVARINTVKKVNFDAAFASSNATRISTIAQRLQREKGTNAPTLRTLFSDDRFKRNNQISQQDAIKVINEIAAHISERQKLINSITGTLKNLTEGIQMNDTKKGATSALFPSLNKTKSIPTILEHMIEHEENDDLGPGSGDRFVIKDYQILDFNIEDAPPAHTMVQVNGLFGDGFVDGPTSLGLDGPGGNVVSSAYAIDYDMWRMYGFRTPSSVQAPFFSDPETQCAPYAVYLLNLARKDILRASCKVTGNEYYQNGDVVYIESYGLLFYVTEVSHSLGYGSNFTTDLTLRYGHNPGEYIPTILDMVGRFMYQTKDVTNYYRSNRFEIPNGDIPVGSIVFPNDPALSTLQQLLGGNVGKGNQKALTQILFSTTGAISPSIYSNSRPVIELRVYSQNGAINPALKFAAETVADWLQNPSEIAADGTIIGIDEKNEGINITKLDNVEIVMVDCSQDNQRTPSVTAWNSVRLFAQTNNMNITYNGSSNFDAVQQDNVLYSNIIDAWLVFKEVPETVSTGPSYMNNNQKSQEDEEIVASAFAKYGAP